MRSPPISSFYARFARRYAVKAFTDFDKHDTSDKHGVLIQHLPYNRVALWKASSDPSTFEDLLASSASSSPLPPFPPPPVSPYTDTGPLVPVESYADRNTPLSNNGRGCMFWAPKTYQPQICVHDVDSTYTVTLRDGQLYKQKCVRASAKHSIGAHTISFCLCSLSEREEGARGREGNARKEDIALCGRSGRAREREQNARKADVSVCG